MGSFEKIFENVTSVELGSSTIKIITTWLGGLLGSSAN